jgi:hypothetical protein
MRRTPSVVFFACYLDQVAGRPLVRHPEIASREALRALFM